MDRRLARLRSRAYFISQCAVAAASAWWVAAHLLGHASPLFAPVAAIVSLGMSYGQRLRRVIELSVGVALGVGIGDVFVHYAGTGVWQIVLVAAVAMALATLVGAGNLLTTQGGVQSVIVVTLVAPAGYAFSRWLDAVIGGLVALLFALVAPASPIRRPRIRAGEVVTGLSEVLGDTATFLRERDQELAERTLARARGAEAGLEDLREASAEGVAVVRLSPLRRRDLPAVQAIADLLEPLDRAIRNSRVLVRRANVALLDGVSVPAAYTDLISDLSRACEVAAAELGHRRPAESVRDQLIAIGGSTAAVAPHPSLSTEVIRAQVRSIVVDLLMLTGLSYQQARERVPPSDDLSEDFHEGDCPARPAGVPSLPVRGPSGSRRGPRCRAGPSSENLRPVDRPAWRSLHRPRSRA